MKGKPRPDGTDDVGRSALAALLPVGEVAMPRVRDVEDGATAGVRGHGVGKQALFGDLP